MSLTIPLKLLPILMLACSNIFYDLRLVWASKYKSSPLFLAILVSWGIAFVEYCFAVPANRSARRFIRRRSSKPSEEVVTLAVFAVFSVLYLDERFAGTTRSFALIGRPRSSSLRSGERFFSPVRCAASLPSRESVRSHQRPVRCLPTSRMRIPRSVKQALFLDDLFAVELETVEMGEGQGRRRRDFPSSRETHRRY